MADNILFLNMFLVSSKCLFGVRLFNKYVTDDKIAMIVIHWRIFGALITDDYWPLNRGLISHSLLQLFRGIDFWPLNGGLMYTERDDNHVCIINQ